MKFGRDFLRANGLAQRGIESPLTCTTGNNAPDYPRDNLAMAKNFYSEIQKAYGFRVEFWNGMASQRPSRRPFLQAAELAKKRADKRGN